MTHPMFNRDSKPTPQAARIQAHERKVAELTPEARQRYLAIRARFAGERPTPAPKPLASREAEGSDLCILAPRPAPRPDPFIAAQDRICGDDSPCRRRLENVAAGRGADNTLPGWKAQASLRWREAMAARALFVAVGR